MDTIIDGYNLIFQCGLEGRSRSPLALQRARDRLIAILSSSFSDQRCARITIVFDAKRLPIKETEAVSKKRGITVMFAVDHDDADTLIEELILKHSSPKQLTVVSSDHRLHKAALRRKATPIDSDVWFDRLEQQQNRPAPANAAREVAESDGDDKPVPDELREIDWQQEFGLGDESEESAEPEKESTYNPFPPGYGDDLIEED